MRALTLTQPWAGLVASGIKLVENRPRKIIAQDDFGKRFAIHASREIDESVYARIYEIAEKVRKFLARYGVSNKVVIGGEERIIGDIGYRLLVPRELFRAQGVGDDYVIDPIGPDGKPLTLTAQIRMCGNMVPPHPAEALIGANLLPRAA